jgi:hypothetical protein
MAALLCGCMPLRGIQREAPPTLTCVRAALRDRLPARLPDKQTHCRATALIAEHCSVSEAYLAGISKEARDLVGPGDAEWGDLRADWAGVRCARAAKNDADAAQCCAREALQASRR